ncbi:hypothetical protein PIROE2DRAFT_16358 [Piromyces sp. E2]|nr:hypothetical protein PIROE2DRAFT_16358 [Piromyces sp. E2]|eukprot:OUM58375.1 hypothetical protein PIROE2DRAFT_16358 [Piromyces sp. E2]
MFKQEIRKEKEEELKEFLNKNFLNINFNERLYDTAFTHINLKAIELLCKYQWMNNKKLKRLNQENDYVKYIFDNCLYNNTFIIGLLNKYNNNYKNNSKSMVYKYLKEQLEKEKSKIIINLNNLLDELSEITYEYDIEFIFQYANKNDIILNISKKNKNGEYPISVFSFHKNFEYVKMLLEYANKNKIKININRYRMGQL